MIQPQANSKYTGFDCVSSNVQVSIVIDSLRHGRFLSALKLAILKPLHKKSVNEIVIIIGKFPFSLR